MTEVTELERELAASDERDARLRLVAWREAAAFLDYAAGEFVADATTRGYLEHVAQCQREEAERRFAKRAGFTPTLS